MANELNSSVKRQCLTVGVLAALASSGAGVHRILAVASANRGLMRAIEVRDIRSALGYLGNGANANCATGGNMLDSHGPQSRLLKWLGGDATADAGEPALIREIGMQGRRYAWETGPPLDDTRLTAALLRHGANPDSRDRSGETALSVAVIRSLPRTTELLLLAGANINAKDPLGCTALFFANGTGGARLIPILVRHGAEVNNADVFGRTPLIEACSATRIDGSILHIADADDLEGVRVLLAHGANPNARARDGATALSNALRYGTPEIVDILRKYGARQ